MTTRISFAARLWKLPAPVVAALAAVLAAAPFPASAATLDAAFVREGAQPMPVAGQTDRWSDVLRRTKDGAQPASADCQGPIPDMATACRATMWDVALKSLYGIDRARQVALVHEAVNALPYRSDRENWARPDYWETPAEMLERGGDCEGFALTKYFALRTLGVADEDLRIAVVWDARDREEHAILLVRMGDEIWFLDNKMAAPERMTDHHDRYRLIYYANQNGLRLPPQPQVAQAEAPRIRLADGGRTLVLIARPQSRAQASATRPGIADVMPAGR